jgi:tetratricopeptide (TPR) repeat protein
MQKVTDRDFASRAFPQNTYIVKEHMLARGNPFRYWNMDLYPHGMVYGFGEGKPDTAIWNDIVIPSFDKLERNIDFKGMTMLVNLHLSHGEDFYEARNTRNAVEQYRKAREIAESSGEASVHNSLGIFFRRQGWPVLARNEYESALKAEHITANEKSNIYVNLGNLEKDRRQFNQAIDYYQKALSINRDNADGQYNYTLAKAYESLESKNYSDAAGYFESALRMPDSDPLINFNLGILYDKNLGDESRAVYYYKKVIEMVPGSREAGIGRKRLLELGTNP